MNDHGRAIDGAELDRIIARAERLRAEHAARLLARFGRAVRDWFGRPAQGNHRPDQTPAHESHLSGW